MDENGDITDTLNYFHFESGDFATTGNISGGGAQCTAGPVTLKA